MHGDIRPLLDQSQFQFLDEQTLAAYFRQWRIQDFITPGRHRQNIDPQARVASL